MSMKKKFLLALLIVNILIAMVCFNKFEARATTLSEMEKQAGNFIKNGENKAGNMSDVTNSITKNFTGLGQILTMIGAGVMVIVVSYMGINYLISPPDKQAALKQQLIGVLVAGIVIFGAYGIWSAILGEIGRAHV